MATVAFSKTLPRDANNFPIQVAQSLQFNDGAGSPVYSPKASVGTSGQAFRVPTGALAFNFHADGISYVNASGTYDGTHGYDTVPANSTYCYPCANLAGSDIYVAAAESTVTVAFNFEMGA